MARLSPVNRLGRVGLFALLAMVGLVAFAPMAGAHPLGNFTVSQSARLRPQTEALAIDHVVDFAEIPTAQERNRSDADGDGTLSVPETEALAARVCKAVGDGTEVTVDGRRASRVRVDRTRASFADGGAGLLVTRVECGLRIDHTPSGATWQVRYENRAYPDRIGWREVLAVGDGTTLLESSAPTTSASRFLTRYPDARQRSPLDQRTAALKVAAGGAGATGLPASFPQGTDAAAARLLAVIGGSQAGFGVALLAMATAVGLGAAHAVAPGHGKTLVAAAMLGGEARYGPALALAGTVALTHTAGVIILGLVISGTSLLVPAQLYPALSVGTGLMVLGIGFSMARRAIQARRGQRRSHPDHHHPDHHHPDHHHPDHQHHDHHHPDHQHHDHDHGHDHDHPDRPSRRPRGLGTRSVIALGLAGGIIPAPSAIIVLLGALAFGQPLFGLALVVAYGLGMAATVLATGLVVLKLKQGVSRHLDWWRQRGAPLVPAVTAAVLVGSGLVLTARGFTGI